MKESLYRGVTPFRGSRLFQARIRLCGMLFRVTYDRCPESAARAFDNALYHLQDFSRRKPRFNFPDDDPGEPLPSVLGIRRTLIELGCPPREVPGFDPPELV